MELSNELDVYSDPADIKDVDIDIKEHAITAAERAELLQLREERPTLIAQVDMQKKKIEWYEQ